MEYDNAKSLGWRKRTSDILKGPKDRKNKGAYKRQLRLEERFDNNPRKGSAKHADKLFLQHQSKEIYDDEDGAL